MLDRLYEAFKATVAAAVAPQKIEAGDPHTSTFNVNGMISSFTHAVPARNHTAGNLYEIVNLANRFVGEEGATPVVWYNREAVTLVIEDEGYRDEKATLLLEFSDVWARILRLNANKVEAALDHAAFIRLLRIELAGTHDKTFLDSIRRIKWSKNQSVTSDKQLKRSASGVETSSEAHVDGGDIAEAITLSVPVYKTNGLCDRYPLVCSIEVIPEEAKLRLLPMPDEMECIQNQAIGTISRILASGLTDGIPAYYGKP